MLSCFTLMKKCMQIPNVAATFGPGPNIAAIFGPGADIIRHGGSEYSCQILSGTTNMAAIFGPGSNVAAIIGPLDNF